MEYKRKNNERAYEQNINKAVEYLKNLINKTEQVIKGKRKDVI
jgi:hypothetical protein